MVEITVETANNEKPKWDGPMTARFTPRIRGLRKSSSVKAIVCLSREEVLKYIDGATKLRDKALLAMLWLTAARVSEALAVRRKDVKHQFVPYDKLSHTYVQKDCMLIEMPISKRREPITRIVPIVCAEDAAFRVYLDDYMSFIKDPESKLFPITRTTAFKLVRNITGLHPHTLRHSRLTWLVRTKGFSDSMLRQYTGWSDSRQAARYTHLNYRDPMRQMMEGGD
jgi:integrase